MGFIKIANATMCRPIQALTQMRGYDVAQHVLACFGGAGGQHACAIARSLGMRTIFVHHYSGILSAVGIGLADVVTEEQVRAGGRRRRLAGSAAVKQACLAQLWPPSAATSSGGPGPKCLAFSAGACRSEAGEEGAQGPGQQAQCPAEGCGGAPG